MAEYNFLHLKQAENRKLDVERFKILNVQKLDVSEVDGRGGGEGGGSKVEGPDARIKSTQRKRILKQVQMRSRGLSDCRSKRSLNTSCE